MSFLKEKGDPCQNPRLIWTAVGLTPIFLLPRQCEHHVLGGSCLGKRAGRPLRLENALAAHRHRNELPAIDLVYSGHAFLSSRQVILPENIAVVLVVGAELSVGWRSREDQPTSSHDDPSTRRHAAGALARVAEDEDTAVGFLPELVPGIQI